MNEFVKITEVTHTGAGKFLLQFSGGVSFTLDIAPYAEKGGVFARLNDPKYVRQAEIAEGGRVLRWPGELDFCADALFEKGKGVDKSIGSLKVS